MKVYPLFEQEAAFAGATHFAELDYTDLTAATNTQTLALLTNVANKTGLAVVASQVLTPFASSDVNQISTAITVGDAGGAARYLASQECNVAAPITEQSGALIIPHVDTADTVVNVYVTATGATVMTTLTAGRVRIYLRFIDGRVA